MLIDFTRVIHTIGHVPTGVIHAGAYTGEEFHHYLANGIDNCIFFEANPVLAEKLRGHVGKDRAFEYLLHEVDDLEIPFKLIYSDDGQNMGCSSVFDLDKHAEYYPHCKKVNEIILKTKSLNTIFHLHELADDRFDFINIDVQGAELLVLKGASYILPYIDAIMTEFTTESLYKGGCQLSDLDEYLIPMGFERKITEFVHPVWGDALYVRGNNEPS